jgi:signal peptidase I
MLATGVGHLYAGAPGRAAVMWLASRVVQLPLLALVLMWPNRLGLGAFVVGWATMQGGLAADAARTTGRSTPTRWSRWFNRIDVCAVAALCVFAADVAWTAAVSTRIAKRLVVRTNAMAPTLVAGDHVFVAASRHQSMIRRGQLVAYRIWDTPFIKRVVAGPGDTIAMAHGVLQINGRAVNEPYAAHAGEDEVTDGRFAWQERYRERIGVNGNPPTLATWGPLVTPSHAYFVLGDARGQSVDSRYDGFIPDTAISGVPRVVFFSWDPAARRVRWPRIGTNVSGRP